MGIFYLSYLSVIGYFVAMSVISRVAINCRYLSIIVDSLESTSIIIIYKYKKKQNTRERVKK